MQNFKLKSLKKNLFTSDTYMKTQESESDIELEKTPKANRKAWLFITADSNEQRRVIGILLVNSPAWLS